MSEFPYGNQADPVDWDRGVIADGVQLGPVELADVEDPTPTKAPYPKVQAAGLGGALATLIVGILAIVGVDVPETVAAAGATVLAFALGYLRTE